LLVIGTASDVRILDTRTWKELAKLAVKNAYAPDPVTAVATDPSNKLLIVAQASGKTGLWDLASKLDAPVESLPSGARRVAFSPSGRYAVLESPRQLVVEDMQYGRSVLAVNSGFEECAAYSGAFSPDEKSFFLVACSNASVTAMSHNTELSYYREPWSVIVQARDVQTWQSVCDVAIPMQTASRSGGLFVPQIAVGPDSKTVVVAYVSGLLVLRMEP
jgi:WD40 repeat protein